MSTVPPAAVAPARERTEITIVSHSNLFYWWPVWAVGFLMGILTWFEGTYGVIVPAKTQAIYDATVIYKDKDGKEIKDSDVEVYVLPKYDAKHAKDAKQLTARHIPRKEVDVESSEPLQPKLHTSAKSRYGVIFAAVLIVVILITNVPLRGMWSVVVIILAVLLVVILALAGVWEDILRTLSYLDIRINMAGYFLISGVLCGIWLVSLLFFDRQMYMIFTPGQLKVCTEIGGGEKVYDAVGMSLEKQRSDLFRHWILGLGSGDLIVKTTGAKGDHFDLPNVLFIGKKVRQIEDMLQTKKVTETK